MKKKNVIALVSILAILVFALTLFIVYIFVSPTKDFININTFSKTKSEELKDEEFIIYNAIIENSSKFINPSSIRVLEISDTYEGIHSSVNLKIQGNNKVGGTITEYYTVYIKDLIYEGKKVADKGDFSKNLLQSSNSNQIKPSQKSSVSKINNAINDYWKDQGL